MILSYLWVQVNQVDHSILVFQGLLFLQEIHRVQGFQFHPLAQVVHPILDILCLLCLLVDQLVQVNLQKYNISKCIILLHCWVIKIWVIYKSHKQH
jgi:hypothetical protein